MKSNLFLAVTIFLTASFSQADSKKISLLGCLDCFNFIAPTVAGAENVNPPEVGLIVYDSIANAFRGFDGKGMWTTLSSKKVVTSLVGGGSVGSSDVILIDSDFEETGVALPSAASAAGREVLIRRVDNYPMKIHILPAGSDLIDGKSDFIIYQKNESLRIISTGTAWEVLDHHIPSEWIPFSMTTQGFGSISSNSCEYRRVGPDLAIRCKFTSGTTTSDEARVYFPFMWLTASTLGSGVNRVGTWIDGAASTATAGNYSYSVLVGNGDNYLTFSAGGSTGTGLTKFPANGIAGSGSIINFNDVLIPVDGWQ